MLNTIGALFYNYEMAGRVFTLQSEKIEKNRKRRTNLDELRFIQWSFRDYCAENCFADLSWGACFLARA